MMLLIIIVFYRMFGPSMDRHMIQTNEYGEYEVAKGIPSRLFAAILVWKFVPYLVGFSVQYCKV